MHGNIDVLVTFHICFQYSRNFRKWKRGIKIIRYCCFEQFFIVFGHLVFCSYSHILRKNTISTRKSVLTDILNVLSVNACRYVYVYLNNFHYISYTYIQGCEKSPWYVNPLWCKQLTKRKWISDLVICRSRSPEIIII